MEDSEGDLPLVSEIHDLETLVQILAIELVATGKYAVLPRASSMRTALSSWEIRMADERAAALERLIGVIMGILLEEEEGGAEAAHGAAAEAARAAGADFALSVEARSLGGVTVFSARVLCAEGGEALAGADRGHRALREGAEQMAQIALLIADPGGAHGRIAALERERRRRRLLGDSARLWSAGAAVGTSFADPWMIGTAQGTAAPLPFLFLRLGCDIGFVSGIDGAGYFSIYPFAHAALFLPFCITPLPLRRGGVYAGAGGGFMFAEYRFEHVPVRHSALLADFSVGMIIADRLDVSYTLRTDFASANGKASVGFIHRFGAGRR